MEGDRCYCWLVIDNTPNKITCIKCNKINNETVLHVDMGFSFSACTNPACEETVEWMNEDADEESVVVTICLDCFELKNEIINRVGRRISVKGRECNIKNAYKLKN